MDGLAGIQRLIYNGWTRRNSKETNRMIKIRFAAILLLMTWLVPAGIVLADLPPAFKAVYRARKAGMTLGEVTVSLHYDKDQYRYEKRTVTKGLLSIFRKDIITELSIGLVKGDKLQLSSYDYHLDRKKKSRWTSIRMSGNKATGQHRGQQYNLEVPAGILDRASIELALMRDAAENPSAPMSYPIVDKGTLKTYLFEKAGNRKVNVPAGNFECVEYRRGHKSDKRSTSLCLAPEASYLPVYATHSEKGTKFFLELVSYRLFK